MHALTLLKNFCDDVVVGRSSSGGCNGFRCGSGGGCVRCGKCV